MYLPKPYFQQVLHYGDLHVDKVIIDYDGLIPVFFSLRDSANKLYICSCYDTSNGQQWIVAPIDPNHLIDVLTDKIPLAAPFRYCADAVIIDWNHETGKETHEFVRGANIPAEILPVDGEFLGDNPDFWADYIADLKVETVITHRTDVWNQVCSPEPDSDISDLCILALPKRNINFLPHTNSVTFKKADWQFTTAKSFKYCMQAQNMNVVFT